MVGMKFGRWTVINSTSERTAGKMILWVCKCECGTIKTVSGTSLRMNKSKSCGCFKYDVAKIHHIKHGHENERGKSRTYTTWDNMTQRCTNPKRQEYKYYGGRGITVCDRWKDFRNFYADMGERPEHRSLDRINYDGNYEPSNCRWATVEEQLANRRPRTKREEA